ncbi:MAG: DUF3352 domain-containing protein [Acidobacteria bacterium]|nr:DUF3352 domain-containing protein [Acidobacteriota bacterium]
MSRRYQVALLGLALAGIAGALYWVYVYERKPAAPAALSGLAAVPADAGLAGGVDVASLRRQQWLVDIIKRASGEVEEAADYRAFVEATGFDYTRDLERLWFGAVGASQAPVFLFVAEGRFDRPRIQDYARKQGAAADTYQGLELFEFRAPPLPPTPEARPQPERHSAFAFLDDTHIAFVFGPDPAALRRAIDCWQGRAPGVLADDARRAEFERIGAGQQAWAVLEPSKLNPAQLTGQASDPGLAELIAQAAFGLSASERGLRLSAEGRCRQAEHAERLHSNLTILSQLGRMALARDSNPQSQAVAEILSSLELDRTDTAVTARLTASPQALAVLLRPPPTQAPAGKKPPGKK